MKIKHNGKSYQCPASLGEIPLKQVIDFQLQYGKDLETFLKNSDPNDEIEQLEMRMDLACKSVSFFTGIPLEEIYKTDLTHVFAIFDNVLSPIFQPQEERTLHENYYFKGELWTIASPQMTFENSMTFNELILGKVITNDMKNFAAGKFEALQKLAVVYFRKVNEKLDESWLSDDLGPSERMQMMAELPMDIVLDIAFFLQSSMSAYLASSQYLESQKAEKDPI